MNRRLWSCLGLCLLALTGCASTPTSSAPKPNRDKLVFTYRQAATALRQGDFARARTLLDDAVTELNVVRADDPAARRSRRTFRRESEKFFLGEPYERVMAFYYRGIIYWMEGELDNARACFRSGQLLDADAQDKTYAADYVLLDYLDAWTTAKLAGDPTDAWKRAQALAGTNALPPLDPEANVAVFAEFGRGPVKYATGQYGEQLRFRARPTQVAAAELNVGAHTLRLALRDDLYFQATTRGGRVMDHVLAGKAVFKATTDAAGDAALISGGILAATSHRDSTAQHVGLGLLAAGLLSKIVSSAATPEADTRQWDNLPQYLSFGALRLPTGTHTGTVRFLDAAGREIAHLRKTVTFTVYPQRDTVLFLSDQNS
jgi:hypothetical protein